jgi:ketosteroid isomerase-like protein
MTETTPEENVELARVGIEAYNRGEIDAVLEFIDPDIEVHTPADFLNTGTSHGRDGFIQWAEQWNEAWDSYRMEIEAVEAVGDHHVVATLRQFARGAGSGVEVEMEIAQMYEVRGGKAIRLHLYPDRDTAVAAAERFQRDPDAAA